MATFIFKQIIAMVMVKFKFANHSSETENIFVEKFAIQIHCNNRCTIVHIFIGVNQMVFVWGIKGIIKVFEFDQM